jgi:peptidyl-tRNA hydrolase, PTH1 family
VGRGEIAGSPILLVKPVTFMNNSGESVSALSRFYKVGK